MKNKNSCLIIDQPFLGLVVAKKKYISIKTADCLKSWMVDKDGKELVSLQLDLDLEFRTLTCHF